MMNPSDMHQNYFREMEIIRKFQATAPVLTNKIATDLKIGLFVQALGGNISGKLIRSQEFESGWQIVVNSDDALVRKRFTIAHEIGHFVLHRSTLKDGVTDDSFYRSNLSSKQETEANAFAADLLMPWHLIREFVDKGDDSPEQLAKAFNVSPLAMKIRLGIPT